MRKSRSMKTAAAMGTLAFASAGGAFLVFFAGWLFNDPAPAWALMLGSVSGMGWAYSYDAAMILTQCRSRAGQKTGGLEDSQGS